MAAAVRRDLAQDQPPTTLASSAAASSSAVRFFLDEGYFLEGDTEILRAYIAASQGRMTISGESSTAFLSVKVRYQAGQAGGVAA